jgi:hypothetical protein
MALSQEILPVWRLSSALSRDLIIERKSTSLSDSERLNSRDDGLSPKSGGTGIRLFPDIGTVNIP